MNSSTLGTYARIAAKALLKGLLIFITGVLFSLITFIIGIWISGNNVSGTGGGHGSILIVFVWLLELLRDVPMNAILILGSLGAMYLYISIALGMILYESIHGFWQTGAGNKISTRISNYVESFMKKYDWMIEGGNKARLKLQLLQQLKNDNSVPTIERRALRYGFKKLKIDKVDWSDKENLSANITAQVNTAISEVVKPSMKPFWILFFVHVACLIAALIFNK